MTCGIYLIENKKTRQKYIGQSVNIEKRWYEHCYNKAKHNSYVENAMQKHGVDNFILKIIEELPNDADLLNKREIYWISYYNTYKDDNHYNLTPGGDFSPMKDPIIAKKQGAKMRGSKNHMYGRKGKLHPTYGRKHTEEEIKKVSGSNNGQYGKILSTNKTGILYLSLCNSNQYPQGYYFEYHIKRHGKTIYKTKSVNFNRIKNKVISDGYPWEVKDNNKYESFLKEYNIKR